MSDFATDPNAVVKPMSPEEMAAGFGCANIELGKLNWLFQQLRDPAVMIELLGFLDCTGQLLEPGTALATCVDLANASDALTQWATGQFGNLQSAIEAAKDRANHTGTQPMSTVEGLADALAGKSDLGHQHAISDVFGLPQALENATGPAPVTSVNGLTGDVVLIATDLSGIGSAAIVDIDTDPTLAADSDDLIATQKATRAYVDALRAVVESLISSALIFQGAIDASGNPDYPAAMKGDAWLVTVAGRIGGASGRAVGAGDLVVAIAANGGGNEATVGAAWIIIPHTLAGVLLAANNLADVPDKAAARGNLGINAANTPVAPIAGMVSANVQAALAELKSSAGGTGTVTSVQASGGLTGLTFSGGPITGAGTLTLGGTLNVASAAAGLVNANVIINANGTLSGAGAGQVTLAGLGAGALATAGNAAGVPITAISGVTGTNVQAALASLAADKNADTLLGYNWTSGQDVSFGVGHFHTPNVGTTGGVRILANPVTGYAYEQILDQNGNQRGFWVYPPDGSAGWSGGPVILDRDPADTMHAATKRYVDSIPSTTPGGAYTLALADAGRRVRASGTVTIPANSAVAFPVDTAIVIFNITSAAITIAISGDTLRQSGSANTGARTLAAFGTATIVKDNATTWYISGAGVS